MTTGLTQDDWYRVTLSDATRPDAPIGYGIVQPGPNTQGGVPVVAIRDLPRPSMAKLHRSAPAIEAAYRRSRVAGDDLLVSVKGTTGRIGLVPKGFRGNISRDVARIRLRAEHDPEFWFQLLQSSEARQTLKKAAVGSTRQELSILTLRSLLFAVPGRVEQQAIAARLMDTDSLISTFERLIAKKQAIKEGMMQQLLTGRTRLPGYAKPWRDLHAGDVGYFKGGSGFPVSHQGAAFGKFPFFKVSDMNKAGNQLFMTWANNYISESQRKQIGTIVMPTGAIVFAKVGAAVFLERKWILAQPSCIDNNMAAFMPDTSSADVRFVYYVLTNFPMASLVATGALPSLNGRQLRSIPLSMPTQGSGVVD
ncbi:restriction endonuclease subunit S [Mycobacterium pseudoshottsii]|uniref:restriction endonuclease subunit S n=1 Tax=Mycobacterium pseudoshottsii TaxID=265949 RepID=UPI00076EDC58|nr:MULTISPECIES: restriction endonuclease subunit S [Mycobacterium ulcerans group]MBC9864310.1 Type I restriction-modification system, specificity subunit S [Mycobacterium pseudoshottsii]GAQ40477.1 type I restriction modification DNA specificity domain protein [Mycobacterium pseudoshottsii JCM 15466]